MFTEKLRQNNPELLSFAFEAHQAGKILPDTYLIDLDAIIENARGMRKIAEQNGISLYFMLKQLGRNPMVAKALMELGFAGCVAVDFREALCMLENQIHLGNVGHLVQLPTQAIKIILEARPDVVTVYSREKISEIDAVAGQLGLVQPLLIRISDPDGTFYSGQLGGFSSAELPALLDFIDSLPNVSVGGFTVFPALLYDGEAIAPTTNMKGMERALKIAKDRGLKDPMVNLPSATCSASIPLIHALGGNVGEPGHGLTGTTPLHRDTEQPERVAYAYVSEVSHNFGGHGYCYGGGHYRRGNMQSAFVGTDVQRCRKMEVTAPSTDSIDYHYELETPCRIGDTVVLCHRTQIFTVRSEVCVVSGLSVGHPSIAGRFTALGAALERIR